MRLSGFRGRRSAALLFLCVAVASPGARGDERPPRPETHGLGWAIGAGNQFAGVGISLLYFLPLPDSRLTFTPNFGLGYYTLVGEQRVVATSARGTGGFSAGLSTSYGYRHRLTADVGFGLLGAAGLKVQGLLVDTIGVYGPFLQAGYEFVSTRGFLFRLCPAGVGYVSSPLVGRRERMTLAATMALGWKLW